MRALVAAVLAAFTGVGACLLTRCSLRTPSLRSRWRTATDTSGTTWSSAEALSGWTTLDWRHPVVIGRIARPARLVIAALVVAAALSGCGQASGPSTAPGGTPAIGTAATPATPASTPVPNPTAAPPTAPSPSAVPATPGHALGAAPTGPTEMARVLRVIDGDTIEIDRGNGPERVRYIGVDTPESVKPGTPVEPYAKEASAFNASLVEGREVVLERDITELDRYGRLLRYVWVEDESAPSGWTFANLALLAAGYAQVVTYPPDVKYVDLYLAAQREAREAGRGLWADEPAETTAPASTGDCDPAYPGVCIPPSPPDLDCGDVTYRRFDVLPPDPHRFDGDGDGIGCETG